jgi:uncharacterized protein (TIRG00374 family)
MRAKKVFTLLSRILVSVVLVGYFLYHLAQKEGGMAAALGEILIAFSDASLQWLIPVCLLHLVGYSLISLRWKILLAAQGVKAGWGRLFMFYFMAAFFNTVLPSTIGGDAVRVMETRSLAGSAAKSAMVVIVERLTGLLALMVIAAAALVIKAASHPGQAKATWLFLILGILGFMLLAVLASPRLAPRVLKLTARLFPVRLQGFLERAYEAVAVYYRHPQALLLSLAVSILFQLNMVVYYFLIAKALGQAPQPLDFMLNIPVVIFLLMTVPAINGLGVRTTGFKELLRFPAAFALAAEMIDLGVRIAYGLLGGLVFLLYRRPASSLKKGEKPGYRGLNKEQ